MRDKAKEGFDFLVNERGYSPSAAAGLLGNFAAESRFNTSALNPGDGSDGSDSIGIAQWNGPRAVGLTRFSRANGYDPNTLRTQLAFADWELKNTHKGVGEALKRVSNPTQAAAVVVTGYERPKGSDRGAQNAHGWQDRNGHATAIFNAFGKGGSTAPQQQVASAQPSGMVELLEDDAADLPARGARPVEFFIPPGGSDTGPRLAGQPSPEVELLDDEPAAAAPRLEAPTSGGAPTGQPRSRVRVTLPNAQGPSAEEQARAERIAEYERQAKEGREAMGPVAATVDTVGRGLARAVPFMDDIAAAGRYATGDAASYQDALDRERAINRTDDTDRPVASYGSQIGAGLALPGGALASSGIRGAAAVGATYGGAYGLGQGDGIGDRLNKGIVGAGTGGALGAGASAALSGVGMAGRFVADKAGVPVGIARGAINPEAEAARRIGMAAERDARLPGAQDDAATFALARENGQPVTMLDEGGETTRALARSAANTSPEARASLQGMVADRSQGQGERVADFLQQITGTSGDATAVREGLKAQARAANRPAYARAYAEGAGGLWDQELQAFTAAPAVQSAIAKASRTGANRAVADGFTPPVSPFARNADGTYALREGADGSVPYPSLQFWDHVKRNLDDLHSVAQRQGRNGEAADIDALRKGLVGKLDDLAPSYAKARSGAAAAFGAQDASEAGQAFVTANMATPDARRAVAALSAPEKALFADGFASSLIDRVRGLADRRDVVNAIFASPKSRERVEIALGRERASKLEAFLRIENVMTQAGRAVTGNSTTARQLMEMGMAGGAGAAGGYVFGDGSASSVGVGAIMGNLARKGALKVDARVAQRVGEMLSSRDPEVVRKATDQIARQPALMKLVRGTEEWLAANLPKVTQPEGPNINLIGGPRMGAASDGQDQPPQR